MRRFRRSPPKQGLPSPSFLESLSEASDRWVPGVSNDTQKDKSDETSFTLTTNSGSLCYKPSEHSNYTDFLRVVIEMTLAFNSGEVDPEFKKTMHGALAAYENGDEFESEFLDDSVSSDDIDFAESALEEAKAQEQKMDEAKKFIAALPNTEQLKLKILYNGSDNFTNIKRILKQAGLSAIEALEILNDNKSFCLPFEKATEVYVQLRMLDVMLNIKAIEDSDVLSKQMTKKAKIYPITGTERLETEEGLITN